MLSHLVQGLVAGENVDQLRARLEPFADGLAYKAQRIARTEGCRVAERAGRSGYEQLGGMLQGLQIVAVMDEWTRPHHAARNGRIYLRGPDGLYRDDAGQLLPDLPDEPNCRCMTIPVLQTPEVLKRNPAALAAFETAAKELIPDPASYRDWWAGASERERMIAVGVKRYQAMRDLLASEPMPREPEWADFIDPKGRLIPKETLQAESPTDRANRRRKVDELLAQRQRAFQVVASTGLPPGPSPPPGGRPPSRLPPETSLKQAIQKIESAIANKEREHGYVLDEAGNVVLSKIGSKTQILLNYQEVAKMDGKILTHNHPTIKGVEPSLSGADVETMFVARLKQIRAVTPHWVYIMERKGDLPDSMEARAELGAKVAKEYRRITEGKTQAFYDKLKKLLNQGKITVEDANRQYLQYQEKIWHETWEAIAPKYGLIYRRESR